MAVPDEPLPSAHRADIDHAACEPASLPVACGWVSDESIVMEFGLGPSVFPVQAVGGRDPESGELQGVGRPAVVRVEQAVRGDLEDLGAVLVDQHPIEVTVQDAYGPATDLRPLVLAVIKAIGL